jgi:8-hydroxy-5-deazaflavin:NADPH oxidoreductase
MRVTIIGTGAMARGIAMRAFAGGHQITLVGTHIAKAADLADELAGEGEVQAADEVGGDLVVLAVPYTEAPHVVRQHAGALAGAVVIDPTNPIDISALEPLGPEYIGPFASGAQAIAAEAPEAAVVKAFNTTFAGTLVAGQVGGRPLDVFLAGDDSEAKARVAAFVRDGGLRPIDAGPLARARELEAAGLLHMAVQGALGTAFGSALAVVP